MEVLGRDGGSVGKDVMKEDDSLVRRQFELPIRQEVVVRGALLESESLLLATTRRRAWESAGAFAMVLVDLFDTALRARLGLG